MATRSIAEGAPAPTRLPCHEALAASHAGISYLFRPMPLADLSGAVATDSQLQRMVDRAGGIARGAAVLTELLEQNAMAGDEPEHIDPFFAPHHRGAVAALVRESLHMLADEVNSFAEACRARGGVR